MKRVLVTGMSGVGKSSALDELRRRGYKTVDTDYDGLTVTTNSGETTWDERRIQQLLSTEDADLLFIGEAPGFHEDQQGEPFVGAAGQLLTEMLGTIGLRREDVYIANVIKCRPPGNRDPQEDEIEACTPWLVEQMSAIQPSLIVTLGNFATKFVLQTQRGITSMRGRVYD